MVTAQFCHLPRNRPVCAHRTMSDEQFHREQALKSRKQAAGTMDRATKSMLLELAAEHERKADLMAARNRAEPADDQ